MVVAAGCLLALVLAAAVRHRPLAARARPVVASATGDGRRAVRRPAHGAQRVAHGDARRARGRDDDRAGAGASLGGLARGRHAAHRAGRAPPRARRGARGRVRAADQRGAARSTSARPWSTAPTRPGCSAARWRTPRRRCCGSIRAGGWCAPRRPASPRTSKGPTADDSPAGDIAFHAVRPYQVGDDPRHVHWMSSARTGQVMVRHYVDTRRPHVTVVVDGDPGAWAGAEFETGVEVAASITVSLLHHAAAGGHGGRRRVDRRAGRRRGRPRRRARPVDDLSRRMPPRPLLVSVAEALHREPATSAIVVVTARASARRGGPHGGARPPPRPGRGGRLLRRRHAPRCRRSPGRAPSAAPT